MKTDTLSDEELVVIVRNRDQEQYREIVVRYQSRLLRYATNLIRDEDKAADVVQVAFINAFVNLRGFDTKRKFSSWIYRIVHNTAINHIKKYKKEVSLEKHEKLMHSIKSNENIEEDFTKKEAQSMLHQTLEKLSLKYREPLVLYYTDDKSYEEISDVLRMPVGTVGTRINRGKKLMKLLLIGKGGSHAKKT